VNADPEEREEEAGVATAKTGSGGSSGGMGFVEGHAVAILVEKTEFLGAPGLLAQTAVGVNRILGQTLRMQGGNSATWMRQLVCLGISGSWQAQKCSSSPPSETMAYSPGWA
jgi:hypothetical protein